MIHLNIGLKIDALGDTEANSRDAMAGRAWMARQALKHWGRIGRWGLVQSDTELTLVIAVDAEILKAREAGAGLSHALGQDCIAMFDPESGMGVLVGHKAEAWGGFKPEYFISPYGLTDAEARQERDQ